MFTNTNEKVRQELERGDQVNKLRNRMNQDLCESHQNLLQTLSPDKYKQRTSYY